MISDKSGTPPLAHNPLPMDQWSFGLTMMLVGVGGTFLTLGVLGLVVDLLKKLFPLAEHKETEKKT